MKYGKNIFILCPLFFCVLSQQVFAMELDVPDDGERRIYIKNNSIYPVRILVGPHYPNSIALGQEQVLDFSLNSIPWIIASNYGWVTHYLSGSGAKINIDHEGKSQDIMVNITYEKGKIENIWNIWNIAKYFFARDKWALFLEPIDHSQGQPESYDMRDIHDALYDRITKSFGSIPEHISRDATFIWSMFPRAASKIIARQPVYPFNILSLDIGGLVASDVELRNWGNYLYELLRRRFFFKDNDAIGNAVKVMIADSVESLRLRKYYVDRDPGYPVTLLHMPGSDNNDTFSSQGPAFSAELPDQLRAESREGASFAKQTMQKRDLDGNVVMRIPTPPPLPDGDILFKSYQETIVVRFLQELAQKRPEEQTLLDKVVDKLFTKINGLEINPDIAIRLKYAALDRLHLVEQNKYNITQLNKVREFMTPAMIRLACKDTNPVYAMQDWIFRIVQAKRPDAYELAQLEEPALQQRVQEEDSRKNNQMLLITHLRQQIKKFEAPE